MNSFNYVTGVTVPYNACNGAYSVQKDNILKCVNKIKYLRLIWRQNHEIQHYKNKGQARKYANNNNSK